MGRESNFWDNARRESFLHTMEIELVYNGVHTARDRAWRAVFDYIKVSYNRIRRHSDLGYLSLIEFELAQVA